MQSAQKSSNPNFQFLLQYALILPNIYLGEYKIKFTFQLKKKIGDRSFIMSKSYMIAHQVSV